MACFFFSTSKDFLKTLLSYTQVFDFVGLQSLVDLKLLEKVVEIILNYSENTKWEIIKQSPEL